MIHLITTTVPALTAYVILSQHSQADSTPPRTIRTPVACHLLTSCDAGPHAGC